MNRLFLIFLSLIICNPIFSIGHPADKTKSFDQQKVNLLKILLSDKTETIRISGVGLNINANGKNYRLNGLNDFIISTNKNGFNLKNGGLKKHIKSNLLNISSLSDTIKINFIPFSGSLKIFKQGIKIGVVNLVSMENYLAGLLTREYEGHAGDEVLKALAVVARTKILNSIKDKKNSEYDFKDSLPEYAGQEGNYSNMLTLVRETSNQVLYQGNNLYSAMYHSSCGGHTDVIKCPYCEAAPNFIWRYDIVPSELEKKLLIGGYKIKDLKSIYINTQTDFGRVKKLHVIAGNGSFYVETETFQKMLGSNNIKSPNFSITANDKLITVIGKGVGHGQGLCKWGAIMLDRKGYKYSDILSKYFPGKNLKYYSNENI